MTVTPMASVTEGLTRKRKWFAGAVHVGKMTGGRRSRAMTSVHVTGRHLPARM